MPEEHEGYFYGRYVADDIITVLAANPYGLPAPGLKAKVLLQGASTAELRHIADVGVDSIIEELIKDGVIVEKDGKYFLTPNPEPEQ